MFNSLSHCLSSRPLYVPSLSSIKVPNQPSSLSSSLNRSFRITNAQSRPSFKKWRIYCFKQDELPADNRKPEAIEDIFAEELVTPKFDTPKAVKNDWISRFREAIDVVFNAIGKPWTVPWTLETILQAIDVVFNAIGKPWTVPWTLETILQVMFLWTASFWFLGSWMIPFTAHITGFSKESLTFRGQAFYSLLTDVSEGLAGIAILARCLSRFCPLPSGWFKFSLKGNWHFDIILGCLMFPLVNRLSQINLDMLPLLPSTPVTLSSVEQSILARDPIAMGLYIMVVSVCAPIWEEIVFRGFLLPSLTRYMPVWCSILVSAIVFALAHFNVQRMLPLIFLGVVMGIVFARSRNLVPSILLHSLWNGFVFLDLMK